MLKKVNDVGRIDILHIFVLGLKTQKPNKIMKKIFLVTMERGGDKKTFRLSADCSHHAKNIIEAVMGCREDEIKKVKQV